MVPINTYVQSKFTLLHSANKYVKNMYDAPKIIPLDMKKLILL